MREYLKYCDSLLFQIIETYHLKYSCIRQVSSGTVFNTSQWWLPEQARYIFMLLVETRAVCAALEVICEHALLVLVFRVKVHRIWKGRGRLRMNIKYFKYSNYAGRLCRNHTKLCSITGSMRWLTRYRVDLVASPGLAKGQRVCLAGSWRRICNCCMRPCQDAC